MPGASVEAEVARPNTRVRSRVARPLWILPESLIQRDCIGSGIEGVANELHTFFNSRKDTSMPEKETIRRARQDKRQGKSPSTQAGEFVHEEIDHVREGKHGARSTKQAIAIGLSKARRAGVKLAPPKKGRASASTRTQAQRDLAKGATHRKPSAKRSRASREALKDAPHRTASSAALSRQAKSSARKRGATSRHNAAVKAAKTKGPAVRHRAAVKAARTRASH
jgi:hypothetical protein